MGIPDIEYEVVVKMSSIALRKAIRDLKDIGEVLTLNACAEGLRLEVTGDMGHGFILLKKAGAAEDSEEDVERLTMTRFENDVTTNFRMRYMNLFLRDRAIRKECTLCMKNGDPITLHYNLGEVAHDFLRFLLAPKQDD